MGGSDLILLRRHFGSHTELAADLDRDGVVGASDLMLVAASFGASRLAASGLFEPDLDVQADAWTPIDGRFLASAVGGIVLDYHGPDRFKFAALCADTDELVVGHYTQADGFTIDAATPWRIDPGDRHALSVSAAGIAVRVRVDGEEVLGHTFGTLVTDGPVGFLALDGPRPFESLPVEGPADAYAIRVLLEEAADEADGTRYAIREIALDASGA